MDLTVASVCVCVCVCVFVCVCVCGIVVVFLLKGGAVYIDSEIGTFTECTFTSNSAVSFHSFDRGSGNASETVWPLQLVLCVNH